jgi:arsenate reductase
LRKIKNCVAFIETAGKNEIIKYLENSPSTDEVSLLKIRLQAGGVSSKEKIWIENFKNINMTDEAIIEALTYQFL